MATVTFLFADQAGSTVQLERLGDAGAKGVRQALIDMLRQAAEDHHGQVVDHTGDGLMLAFASAVDAVECGVVVQQQAARHNARRPEAEALGVRVGIHTGEPLVNDEGRWFGVPVVVAARLCAVADSGQVLVSDVTRALVAPRRAHGFTPLGERALKGIADPVAVAAVDWAPEETQVLPPKALALRAGASVVGRDAELAWLEERWEQATAAAGTVAGGAAVGRRRVVLLAGDPGIGKTQLAASFARTVWERGGLVLYGGCDEQPTGPYQPLAEALGPYVAAVPRAELRQQLGPAGGVLTRVLPELAERVPHLAGPARLEPETEGLLVAEAFEQFLVAVSRTTPTLLVLDDLHWADPAALAAVGQLAKGTAPAPLLVLGCYREPDVGRSRVLTELGVDPRRPGPIHHRRLGGLSADSVADLLDQLTGERPSPELVRTVDAETEGNPFFVHQMAANLVERTLAQQVGRTARQVASTRLDLRGVREELVTGVLELQRLRDRPAGQGSDMEGHAGLLEAEVEPDGTPPVPTEVPYKGLVRFEAPDAGLFHGRERLVAQLVARLVAARFVAVVGPSGSGKSSLVRAGLLPALAGGALPGSDGWAPLVLSPGPRPLEALAERLTALVPGIDADKLPSRLAVEPAALDELAAEALAGRPADARLLVVVDQFEEVFTACRDDTSRRGFVDLLVTAARAREGRCVVVLALRADFYGRCAAHPELAAELADSQVLVGPMTDEELRAAVVEPARRVGCVVEPGLVEAVVHDVAAAPGALPLVSTALLETWERRRGRSLTVAAYAESGGVHGAVARLADGVHDSFDAPQREVARSVFLRLTEPGEGAEDVRRRARRDELGGDAVTDQVLATLVARRLVIADQGTVEVAHEALLREWPRLRDWLEEDREGRRLHRQLGEAADDWVAHDRDPEQLYRGARLGAAVDWARRHDPDLNQREREFLDASSEHHDAQLRAARRSARRLRALAGGLAVLLVVAVVAGSLALVARSATQRQAVLAQSRGLAAQASERADQEPDLALLLAVEGHRLQDSVATRSGLLAGLGRVPQLTQLHQQFGNDMARAELGPDGSTLAVLGRDGMLRLWDFPSGSPRSPPVRAHDRGVDLAFSHDGRVLVSSGSDGLVRLWDPSSGAPLGKPLRHQGPVGEVAVSSDGTRVASVALEEGAVHLWALASGKPIATLRPGEEDAARAVAFSPARATLAVGTELGFEVPLFDGTTGRRLGRLQQPAQERSETAVAFSPDGSLLATGGNGVTLWDARTRRQRRQLSAAGFAGTVRFSPDGSMLASTGEGIQLWDVAGGVQVGRPLTGHTGQGYPLAFLDRPARLVTASSTEVATWDLGAVGLGQRVTGGHRGAVHELDLSPDGRTLASAGIEDGTVRLWDVAARRPAGEGLKTGAAGATDVEFSPDGRLLAAGTSSTETAGAQIVLWDLASRRRVGALQTGAVQGSFSFSPDGRTIAADDGRGNVGLWDVAGRRKRTIVLRDADSLHQVVIGIAFSPDGRTLATGGRDGKVNFWDVATGARRPVGGPAHGDLVTGLAFSADGSLLASSGAEGAVLTWDTRTGERVGDAFGGAGAGRVAVAPDNRTMAATAGQDVALWDLRTRRQVGVLAGHADRTVGVAYLAGGQTLVTSSFDGSLIFWDLRPGSWAARACALAGRNLTRDEWRQLVSGDYRRTCPQWPEGVA